MFYLWQETTFELVIVRKCGQWPRGRNSGGEAGWVGSDISNAISVGGRLERRHAHHLKSQVSKLHRRRKENLS